MPTDDRTTKAKIRDAAIREIAARPAGTTTVRDIASAAGVSPGSVIHHYGSMDGLHKACNEYVAGVIRAYKSEAVAPQGFDLLASLRSITHLPITGYLAKAAMGDSAVVADLIDGLVDDAVEYMGEGVEAGTILPTGDQRGRATVLLLWSLGGLLLHNHLERLLGIDITDAEALIRPEASAYTRPALDLLAHGIFTDSYTAQVEQALDAAYRSDPEDSSEEHTKGQT